MKSLAGVAILLACLPGAGAEVTACRRDGNLFVLDLSDGRAEIEWVSLSAFRFSRQWTGLAPKRAAPAEEPLDVSFVETDTGFDFRTRYLTARIENMDARLSVTDRAGKPLFSDTAISRSVEGVRIEKTLGPEERFFGLGVRQTPKLDLRGMRIRPGRPFLISSAGYGEYYRVPANYVFDLGQEKPERRSVVLTGANRVEYFVYYGPEPKQILEEHLPQGGTVEEPEEGQFSIRDTRRLPLSTTVLAAPEEGSWNTLRNFVHALCHASLSAVLLPDFDLTPYLKAPAPVRARAGQLAGVLPLVHASAPGEVDGSVAESRLRVVPIFVSYAHESRDRGFPLVRPMAMQFPKDATAIERTDQFMVGDELLAAPILDAESRRSVYLPMGQWTELRTNKRHKGRQTIEIEAGDDLPLFAKNGSIVPFAPLAAGRPLELHYFPNIGGEFFLYEKGALGYSQIHAGPAGDYLRLEIETLAARGYEWIVHHAPPCGRIQSGSRQLTAVKSRAELKPGTWFYDEPSQNLHVRVDAKAGDDVILNISN